MSSPVIICSNALLRVGGRPIASLTQETDHADLCNSLYDVTKRSVLRSHAWNCAIKRVALAPTTTEPAFDWAYEFQRPADWLKTLQVGTDSYADDYIHEGDKILCDSSILYLRYVADIEEALFDPMLQKALELSLAHAIAYPVSGSAALRDSLLQELEMHMKRARAVDGQDDPGQQIGNETLLISAGY